MTWLEWMMIVVVAVLVVLPPKWDPAVWLKERNERKKGNNKW